MKKGRRRCRYLTMRGFQQGGIDLRLAVYIRCRGKCWYCGMELHIRASTLDHIIPIACGGLTALDNLALACGECNRLKDQYSIEQFRVLRGGHPFFGEQQAS